jgi:hypothetical protein
MPALAPASAYTIHGVAINGTGATGGTNGIVFNSGGSLTVTNCVVQNFIYDGINPNTGNGIFLAPTSGTINFFVTNTIVSNNGSAGIAYFPPSGTPSANVVLDHIVATANLFGVSVGSGFTSGGSTVAAISNSVVAANTIGLFAGNGPGPLTFSIDNVSAVDNGNGIYAAATANVLLGRSVITGNGTGVTNLTSPNTFYTYGNNQINLNTTADTSSALNTTFTPR